MAHQPSYQRCSGKLFRRLSRGGTLSLWKTHYLETKLQLLFDVQIDFRNLKDSGKMQETFSQRVFLALCGEITARRFMPRELSSQQQLDLFEVPRTSISSLVLCDT